MSEQHYLVETDNDAGHLRHAYVIPAGSAVQATTAAAHRDGQRTGLPDAEIRTQVAVGPYKTTYRQKYRTSHGGHALATLVTCGLWAPVWLFCALANAAHPGRKVTQRHHYRRP